MSVMKRALKVIVLIILIITLLVGVWCFWWYAPVSVNAVNVVKIIDSDISSDQVRFCDTFVMTPNEFSAYWKDVRPIFDSEFHNYSFGSCYFRATEGGREYSIGIGGVGMVTNGDTSYYYVRKNDKPDFSDMK